MRSRSFALVAGFGLLLVVAIGVRGAASYSGVRWLPDWSVPTSTTKPQQASPAPLPSAPPPQAAPSSTPVDAGLILLAVAVIVILIVILLIVRRWLRRRRSLAVERIDAVAVAPSPTTEPEPDAPALRRGFDLALHVLDTEREPRDAIVKAWLGLQDAAEDSGIRRGPAETPTEFTSRILGRVVTDERAIATLLRLYLGVRFGGHPVTERDIADARAGLESLAASWRDEDAPVEHGGRP